MRWLSRVPRLLKELVLTVGAIGGLACILLAIGALAFGLRPLVVQSGSMEPTVPTGSLLITQKTAATELAKGDVVTVRRVDRTLVTHRITDLTLRGKTATLRLKGDANDVADPQAYQVTQADRKVAVLPYLGYAAAWASSSVGLFLLGLYVAFLVAVVVADVRGRSRDRSGGGSDGGTRKASRRAVPAVGLSALMVGLALVPMTAPRPTLAAWTDDATAGTSTLAAYTVPKPGITGCTVTGGVLAQKTATIVWTEISSPYALDYTATINETGQSMTVTDNGSTRQTQFSAGLLSTVLNQTYNIRITARLPAPNGSWTSVQSNQPVTITLLGLGMTCGTAS